MVRNRGLYFTGTAALVLGVLLSGCRLAEPYGILSLSVRPEETGRIIFIGTDGDTGEHLHAGSRFSLRAEAENGWAFTGWKGDIPASKTLQNPLELTFTADMELEAVFAPRWNFLVYLAADNDLETWLQGMMLLPGDLVEMGRAGSSEAVEVLLLLDRQSTPGTVLYRLGRGTGHGRAELVPVKDYGELDMSDPATLENFLVYTATNFPAQHTVLTLWNHGSGVYPRGIGYDSTTVSSGAKTWPFNCLTTDDVELALRNARETTGVKPDILQTDACLMQMAEIAWQWQDETSCLVGSPASVPALGNDYEALLRTLAADPYMEPEAYARKMVDTFMDGYSGYSPLNIVFSAVATGERFGDFAAAFREFSEKLLTVYDAVQEDVRAARALSTDYRDSCKPDASRFSEFIDLGDFLRHLSETPAGKLLSGEISGLVKALDAMTLRVRAAGRYERTGDLPSSGLAVLFPRPSEPAARFTSWATYERNGYRTLRLPSDSSWDEMIALFNAP